MESKASITKPAYSSFSESRIQVEDVENAIALDVIQTDDSQYNGCFRQKHVALIETLAAHDHHSFLPRPGTLTQLPE